jgi:hypothetical protein
MNEKYAMLKTQVAPQHVMCMEHLSDDYFVDALWICKKLGLIPLMTIQQDYNVQVIQHFFSTLVFGQHDTIDFYRMTSDTPCQSTMVEFGALLGYEYGGANDTSYGKRMHVEGDFEPGKAKGLKLLYNILLRIFRENIVLSSGNEDDIRGALVDLLLYSHRICRHGDEEPPLAPLDVVDFIYKEMYLCMLDVKKAPIYAPFIMKLILQKAPTCPLVTFNLVNHKVGRPQKKKPKGVGGSGASASRAPFASSEEEHVLDAHRRPRMKRASNATTLGMKLLHLGRQWVLRGRSPHSLRRHFCAWALTSARPSMIHMLLSATSTTISKCFRPQLIGSSQKMSALPHRLHLLQSRMAPCPSLHGTKVAE